MHHSFFTTALLIASSVFVQAQDNTLVPPPTPNANAGTPGPTLPTPAGGTPNPAAGTPNPAAGTPNPAAGTPNPAGGNPPPAGQPGAGTPPAVTTPKPIQGKTTCTDTFLPFSERELAQMALLDTSAKANTTGIPDPNSLSNVPSSTFCKSGPLTSVCMLNSCNVTLAAAPVCTPCYDYTPNPSGEGGTVGTVVTATNVVCDDSYNFNKTDTTAPFVCSTKLDKSYSCGSCTGARVCETCYDVKDLAPGP